MCLSIYFAQVIGLYLVITSLASLIQQERFKKIMHEFLMNPTLVGISGCVSVLIGILILVPHDLWVTEWPVIITLLGWIALLNGIFRLFLPETFVKYSKEWIEKKGYLLVSWIWFLIGLYLLWAGCTY